MSTANSTRYNNYCNSNTEYLHQVYSRCSYEKQSAYERCLRIMREYDGYDLRITSFNTFVFTVAFRFTDSGIEYLCYITPSHNYIFAI